MRPRKRLLLYCADEDQLGRTAFVLRIRGEFLISPACAVSQVVSQLARHSFHVAVVMAVKRNRNRGEAIVKLVKDSQPRCQVVLAAREIEFVRTIADRKTMLESAVLLDAIKMAFSRKLGPRKLVAGIQA